jgi:hypothetical protein
VKVGECRGITHGVLLLGFFLPPFFDISSCFVVRFEVVKMCGSLWC